MIKKATHVTAERFSTPESSPHGPEWLDTWSKLKLSTLPGFPLWEKQVFDALSTHLEQLRSIFNAYAAGQVGGSSNMEKEELHDFVIEADLITDQYGFDTMAGQFTKANAGSDDDCLELHEFLTMLVRCGGRHSTPRLPLH